MNEMATQTGWVPRALLLDRRERNEGLIAVGFCWR